MRYIPVIKADTGMVLGQDIYDGEGKVLLGKGLMMDGDAIQKVLNLGLPGIYVDNGFGETLKVPRLVSEELQREALRCMIYSRKSPGRWSRSIYRRLPGKLPGKPLRPGMPCII